MRKLVSFFPSRCLAGALEFRMNIVYIIICDKHHEVAEIPPGRELSNLIEAFIHFEHTATASYCC